MTERDLFVIETSKRISREGMLDLQADVTKQLTDAGVDSPTVLVVENGAYVSHERVKCSCDKKHTSNLTVKLDVDTASFKRKLDDAVDYAQKSAYIIDTALGRVA